MQYVGRAIGSVTKSWSSINPATLSGAIDVIVVEHLNGELSCSPFHVRFGKFQILKPSQKKVEVIVNGQSTNIPMKLGDSGEAYFVFETDSDLNNIPDELIASPIVSAASSPSLSPRQEHVSNGKKLPEPDFLDINDNSDDGTATSIQTDLDYVSTIERPMTPTSIVFKSSSAFEERMNRKLNQKKIPSKVDNNGDLLLDIEGYKSSQDKVHDTDEMLKQLLQEELGKDNDISPFVKEDDNGNIRIVNPFDHLKDGQSPPDSPAFSSESLDAIPCNNNAPELNSDFTDSLHSQGTISSIPEEKNTGANYIKTIRLTSDQLRCLELKYGENDLTFSIDKGKAFVNAKLFLWKWDVPIVISDIDGTITKSDALGHVLTMIGKDWTHPGVAKLFTEIQRNGYNIMYLTARSAGQADSTRSYLRSIQQGGCSLPIGPVVLSPDRTMAALRREVIFKKPEVFKISCLNDIRKLYFKELQGFDEGNANSDEQPTPFYAGFGNRITDALSYRTVGIPSSRIFTINPDGEVHMELLELTALRSSYVHINELVDQFFPHVKQNPYYRKDDELKSLSPTPGSPMFNPEERSFYRQHDEKFSDVNFWRDPVLSIEDFSDISDDCDYTINDNIKSGTTSPPRTSSPLLHVRTQKDSSPIHEIELPTLPILSSAISYEEQKNMDSDSNEQSPKLEPPNRSKSVESHLEKLGRSKPIHRKVTNLNVLQDANSKSYDIPQDLADDDDILGDEYTDDEFDEDEFDEDEFMP
ncbi:phosphatidate phosphatase PAH1 Ecym_5631 [Eremothecium cymbalariae DBVPG|uniref:LNS2/PITP domain-containing protein n=1 Tax=Eremothecium cymbalariae (strain CBS 270.75 / DBVPG 7215 / KCTC 17166 / NRRL Y-17582) TaxID=931890 RepID=I6NE75_ERECY|nr:hypothetical protein Ecym_5631 [Eremothecium cymbalariae DBVPG\